MRKVLVLFLTIIFLSGCSGGERYDFIGKSKSWSGTYTVDVQNQDRQQTSGTLTYVGEGNAPEEVSYVIKGNINESTGVDIPVTENTAGFGANACTNCAVVNENEEIKIEVSWDEEVEELILKTE